MVLVAKRWRIGALAVMVALVGFLAGHRVVKVAPRLAPVITAVPTAEKVVALTFDDGPTPQWTPKILAVLKANGVPATFFVIGQEAVQHPNLISQEVQDGMEIANHGFSHRLLRRLNPEAITSEVQDGAMAIEAAGAKTPHLYRMPAGVYDQAALKILGEMGYTVIGWSVDPRDWRHRYTAQQMLATVLRQVGPGRIIIFHDGTNSSAATVQAVAELIPALKSQGYRFMTVGQMLKVVKGRL